MKTFFHLYNSDELYIYRTVIHFSECKYFIHISVFLKRFSENNSTLLIGLKLNTFFSIISRKQRGLKSEK